MKKLIIFASLGLFLMTASCSKEDDTSNSTTTNNNSNNAPAAPTSGTLVFMIDVFPALAVKDTMGTKLDEQFLFTTMGANKSFKNSSTFTTDSYSVTKGQNVTYWITYMQSYGGCRKFTVTAKYNGSIISKKVLEMGMKSLNQACADAGQQSSNIIIP